MIHCSIVWKGNKQMSLQIDVLAPKFINLDPISGFLTVFIEGKQYTIRASDQSFPRAVEAYKLKLTVPGLELAAIVGSVAEPIIK